MQQVSTRLHNTTWPMCRQMPRPLDLMFVVLCVIGLITTYMSISSSELRIKQFPINQSVKPKEQPSPSSSKSNHVKDLKFIAIHRCSDFEITTIKPVYEVGDEIKVHIVIRDGYNRRKRSGGDYVRMWIKDVTKGACANGIVKDNNNGTYTGTITLPFEGRVKLVVSLATPKETLDALYSTFNGKRIREIIAGYNKNGISEDTTCRPEEHIPGYDTVCNYTSVNYGFPWYCGRPSSKGLMCSDWNVTRTIMPELNYTDQYKKMFRHNRLHRQLKSKSNVYIVVSGDSKVMREDNRTPCHDLSPRLSWPSSYPSGYLWNWTWYVTHCRSTFHDTPQRWNECLKFRTVWMFGDSTTRQFLFYLMKYLNLPLVTEKWLKKSWHKPSLLQSQTHNYTIFWGPHCFPFHNGIAWENLVSLKATHAYIDEIPNRSRDIVVIHFYLHFMAYHPDLYRWHVRRTRQSVAKLKSRAPDTLVFVKGSHAFRDHGAIIGRTDDIWGGIYDKIVEEEFIDLRDSVIFLNMWDMTVASENKMQHPNRTIVRAMVNYMMGFVKC
ncbi:NXPE family member 4-like [Haliotis asinina]|uniref:NXPE family member 4-like n=1 Tax=Haliotis asinina TaxID=109174 RepID=UPI00353212F4